MTQVLSGIRVVEVSGYAFVPSAAAVLADWGADVVKVEHPEHGDPVRGLTQSRIPPGAGGFTFMWELCNRGKRSVGIDLRTNEGRALLLRLVADADVFVTSMLAPVRRKLGIDFDDIRAANPAIVVAQGTGQGSAGPDAEKGGFDLLSFWSRTGIAAGLSPVGAAPANLPGPGFGDLLSGATLAGGIAAALFHRERTGEAVVVDVSLLSTGLWAMQPAIVATTLLGLAEYPRLDRLEITNPLVNSYRTADDRYLMLTVLQTDRYWPAFCAAIGAAHLVDDGRFATAEGREEHAPECIRALDELFATRPLAHWIEALSGQDAQWDVVQLASEVVHDAQAQANGYLVPVNYGSGREITLVRAPVTFDGTVEPLRPAEELGASTEAVALELGLTWEQIAALKDGGVIS